MNKKIKVITTGIILVLMGIPFIIGAWINMTPTYASFINSLKLAIIGAIPFSIGTSTLVTLSIVGWDDFEITFLNRG